MACKRPWSFCQKCRWQVTARHACTHNPAKPDGLTILSRDSVGIHHGRVYQTFSHDTRKQKEKAATATMRVDVSVSGQLSATNDIRHITSAKFLFTHWPNGWQSLCTEWHSYNNHKILQVCIYVHISIHTDRWNTKSDAILFTFIASVKVNRFWGKQTAKEWGNMLFFSFFFKTNFNHMLQSFSAEYNQILMLKNNKTKTENWSSWRQFKLNCWTVEKKKKSSPIFTTIPHFFSFFWPTTWNIWTGKCYKLHIPGHSAWTAGLFSGAL